MLEQLEQEHINYIKHLLQLQTLAIDTIKQHSECFHQKDTIESIIQIELPNTYHSNKYFRHGQYQYFTDRWGLNITFSEYDGKYFMFFNYSKVEISFHLELFSVLSSDLESVFNETMRIADDFYILFEKPFYENPQRNFVELFFMQRQYHIDQFPFKLFIPHFNKIEEVGITLDLDCVNNNSNENFFAVYLGERIKFIPEKQWKLEKFKLEFHLDDLGINYPEAYIWMCKTIAKLNETTAPIFISNYRHITDFLLSEDINDQILKTMEKINLHDMIRRSQMWINKMSKEVLIEHPGDCEDILVQGDLKIVQLLTPHALDRESAFLCHCIGRGSYDKILQDKDKPLYSVRNKKNEPLATIEVQSLKIIQIQGFQNRIPPEITKDIIKTLITQKGLSVKNLTDNLLEFRFLFFDEIDGCLSLIEI